MKEKNLSSKNTINILQIQIQIQYATTYHVYTLHKLYVYPNRQRYKKRFVYKTTISYKTTIIYFKNQERKAFRSKADNKNQLFYQI